MEEDPDEGEEEDGRVKGNVSINARARCSEWKTVLMGSPPWTLCWISWVIRVIDIDSIGYQLVEVDVLSRTHADDVHTY